MRRGFTLIELIFVIVIIGVLSAVAVPKFTKLKGSATGASAIKVGKDAFTSVPSAYVNSADLNGNNPTLNTLIKISGKNWDTTTDVNKSVYNDGGAGDAITVTLNSNRTVDFNITCGNFKDSDAQTYCTNSGEANATLDF